MLVLGLIGKIQKKPTGNGPKGAFHERPLVFIPHKTPHNRQSLKPHVFRRAASCAAVELEAAGGRIIGSHYIKTL